MDKYIKITIIIKLKKAPFRKLFLKICKILALIILVFFAENKCLGYI